MTLAATGGPSACARCGRPVPRGGGAAGGWAGRLLNGRLVELACPECLTGEEGAEAARREGSALWEAVSGRRADAGTVGELAAGARAAGRVAPAGDWFERLDAGAPVTGLIAAEGSGADVRVLWVGTAGGAPVAAAADVPIARWLDLEEVFVPAHAAALAAQVASGAAY